MQRYYKDKFYDDYKNSSIEELEFAIKQNILYGSDGKGRMAELPLLKDQVLNKILTYRKGQNK